MVCEGRRILSTRRLVYTCYWLFANWLIEAQFLRIALLTVHRCFWWVGVLIGVEATSQIPQQDDDAPQSHEAKVVLHPPLVAHYQPSEVTQPGKEALYFLAPLVASEFAAVLIEDTSGISPRSATAVGPANGIGDQRFAHFPLCVGQVHVPPRLEQLNTQPFSFPIRVFWRSILGKATGRWC